MKHTSVLASRQARSILFPLAIVTLSACGGSGGGSSSPPADPPGSAAPDISLGAVAPLYPDSGSNWNDYVNADGSVCTASSGCLHGGELRVVEIPELDTCEGISAQDALGALRWSCVAGESGGVRIVSGGLMPDQRLATLLDWEARAWRSNELIVSHNGREIGRTEPAIWWENEVSVTSGGQLNNPGTIYLLQENPVSDIALAADGVALVAAPELRAVLAPENSANPLIAANGRSHLWLEGDFLVDGRQIGVRWQGVTQSVMNHVSVSHANGLVNRSACIELLDSDANRLHQVNGAACEGPGLVLRGADDNELSRIVVSNNRSVGLLLESSSDNQISGVLAASNLQHGVSVQGGSGNVLAAATVVNNGMAGMELLATNNNSIAAFSGTNNTSSLYLSGSSENRIIDIISTGNHRHSVIMNDYEGGSTAVPSQNNYFSGELRVDPPRHETDDRICVDESGNGGLFEATCTSTGEDGSSDYGELASDAVLRRDVSQATAYLGRITADDTANSSDAGGAAEYQTGLDWSRFDHWLRVWGLAGEAGVAFPADSLRAALPSCSVNYVDNFTEERCLASESDDALPVWQTQGRIWDFRLAGDDQGYDGAPAQLGVLAEPGTDDVATHTWANGSETVYLRRAIEISGDGVGNDNLLCEAGETCLYTPNLGAYQGHGELVPAANVALPSGEVSLVRWSENGL